MHVFMGGTFDPVHFGHIKAALEVRKRLQCETLYLMPTLIPVHKAQACASAAQRLAMLEMAIRDCQGLQVDSRELRSKTPCYTVNTLRNIRSEVGEMCPVVMVIGMDSYLNLPRWRDCNLLLSLCHIVVVQRPGYHLVAQSAAHQQWVQATVESTHLLAQSAVGRVLFIEQSPLDISSSDIRADLARSTAALVPQRVTDYIHENQLYAES